MDIAFFLSILGAVLVGFAVTAVLTPLVRRRASEWGLCDRPTHERKTHSCDMPTGGGLAIAAGMGAGFTVLYGVGGALPEGMQSRSFWGGALLMLGAGFWDDRKGIDPKTKFALQLVAAYLLLHAGIHLQVGGLTLAEEGEFIRALYVVPLSLLWIVGVTNAINLVDGLDGLATGVTGIAFLACAALFGVTEGPLLMATGIVMAGTSFGFLPHNSKPASIFMGDSGSLFLGYMLAAYTLQGSLHPDPTLALLILPLLLGVPVLDTGAAIVRRARSDRSIFAPDRNHIHHRLTDNRSESRAVLTLYRVGAWFGSAAILIAALPIVRGGVLAGGTAVIAFVWVWRLGCLTPLPPVGKTAEKRPAETGPPSGKATAEGNVPLGRGDEFAPKAVQGRATDGREAERQPLSP